MINERELERIGRELLIAVGEDPDRDGLKDTPSRWARMWREFFDYKPGSTGALFNIGNSDSIVAVTGINVWSLCEHHLLPFSTELSIAYIPSGPVLGLSKFARIAHDKAHRLQVQERLTQEIADAVTAVTGSRDVAVIAKGHHLCMTMRGIKTEASMHTSIMRGIFKESPSARTELLQLITH